MNKRFSCPLTKQTVNLYYLDNTEDLSKKHNLPDTSKVKAFVFSNEGSFHVVFLKQYYTTGTLVHETVHLVNFIFEHIGQRLDSINDEIQAYYTQYWFEKFYKEIEKYNIN